MAQAKTVTQQRVLNAANKLYKKLDLCVATKRTITLFQAGGFFAPTDRADKEEKLQELKELAKINERKEISCVRRISRLVGIQLKHDVSGIVWREVNQDEGGLSFPSFHPALQMTASDMEILKEWKPAVIEYAIEAAIGKGLTFFRKNPERQKLALDCPKQIWSFSSYYDWAMLYLENEPLEIHLMLGNGRKELADESIWFFATVEE